MFTRGGAACKVCIIITLVVFVLVVGVSAFLLLYTPKAEDLSKKISSDDVKVFYYEEGKTEYSSNIKKAISFMDTFEVEYTIKEVIEFYSASLSEDDDKYVEGYIFYLDGIGSSFKFFTKYLKYLMDTDSDSANGLEHHFSSRGNILFVGNTNAEIEFRKVIF